MKSEQISLASPRIGAREREFVDEVLRGTTLSGGPRLEEFERQFAARCGSRHAIAVSSGTAGLHLTMIAAGVTEGDFVITSPFSFIASSNASLYEGGVPVFVDIDPDTLMLDVDATLETATQLHERKRGWRKRLPRQGVKRPGALRAILPVHVFGRPMELAEVTRTARTLGVALVEDACEAVGATIDSRTVGTWGDAGVFAFYPNKQITCGEGGMIVTDRAEWAALARSLRNQGRDDQSTWLRHTRLGYNYRLDEMSAALGLCQLQRLDEFLARRAELARLYATLLESVEGATPLPLGRVGAESSWFVYAVRLDPDVDRTRLMARLAERGVPSRPYFSPIHLQPLYIERFGYRPGDFPNAEKAGETILALPFHTGLAQTDLEYIVDQLRSELPLARRTAPRIVISTRVTIADDSVGVESKL